MVHSIAVCVYQFVILLHASHVDASLPPTHRMDPVQVHVSLPSSHVGTASQICLHQPTPTTRATQIISHNICSNPRHTSILLLSEATPRSWNLQAPRYVERATRNGQLVIPSELLLERVGGVVLALALEQAALHFVPGCLSLLLFVRLEHDLVE